MEYSTKGTHLDYSTDGTTFKELYGLNTFPDMGGEPQRIEVTNMKDEVRRYLNGVQDTGSLTFEFYYNKETTADSGNEIKKAFITLSGLSTTLLHWKLVFPDNSSYSWQGKPTVFMKAGNVNEPLKFSLTISLESGLTFAEGSGT